VVQIAGAPYVSAGTTAQRDEWLSQWAWVMQWVVTAQQLDRAAPHTGVPEIVVALSGCCADAVESAQGQLEYRMLYIDGRLTDGDGRNHAECVAFVCQIGLWSLFHLH